MRIATIVFGLALVVLVLGVPTGAWDAAAGHAVLAARHDHLAAAPLYGVIAGAAAELPVGEVAFRLGLLGAVLGALTLAGVVAAARAWLPKDPIAGVVGAVLLILAPPFRDAAGFADPSMLAACGAVWTIAFVLDGRSVAAIACAGVVVGSAPWLGLALLVIAVAWLARRAVSRGRMALAVAGVAALGVGLWATATGPFPSPAPSASALLASSGRGAAAVVIGSGLLGLAFGAATGLPSARWLGLVAVATTAAAIIGDPSPAPLLAVLAVGVAVIPSGIVRAAGGDRRTLVAALAGVPLVAMALVVGPALSVDDPEGAPARLATDVIGALPGGPGVIVLTDATRLGAVGYERTVAGARPDLSLAPLAPPEVADAVIVQHLRSGDTAGADVPALGRLDPRRAMPRNRGFQIQLPEATVAVPPLPPARYASAIGERQAVELAVTRARYEAGAGHLDAAARAAGLTTRFHAADLAVLATTVPSRERPALYGFVPSFPDEPARVRLELFGDDLAWVAGLEQPAVTTPPSRHLHALWREVLRGMRKPDDPAIAALGPAAVAATSEMLAAVGTK